MKPFRLGHSWSVNAQIDDVFYFVSHIGTWPSWWPQIVSVTTSRPDDGVVEIGDSATMWAKSLLPYTLEWDTTVVEIAKPRMIRVKGHVKLAGQSGSQDKRQDFRLSGDISFELFEEGGLVKVVNRQAMTPETPVSTLFRPLYSAVFKFNHWYAMRNGLPGLKQACAKRSEAVLTKTQTH